MTDFTLPEDLDEIVREADIAVEKVRGLDAQRAAAFAALKDARQAIVDKAAAAVTKIDAYLNPSAPAPTVEVSPAPEPAAEPDPIVTIDPVVNAEPVPVPIEPVLFGFGDEPDAPAADETDEEA